MSILLRWFANAATLLVLSMVLPGITVTGWAAAFIAALVLGLVNLFLRPILVVLTLPINILTLGLFTFIINAFLFWLAGEILRGFEVNGFFTAIIGALVMSAVNALVSDKSPGKS